MRLEDLAPGAPGDEGVGGNGAAQVGRIEFAVGVEDLGVAEHEAVARPCRDFEADPAGEILPGIVDERARAAAAEAGGGEALLAADGLGARRFQQRRPRLGHEGLARLPRRSVEGGRVPTGDVEGGVVGLADQEIAEDDRAEAAGP